MHGLCKFLGMMGVAKVEVATGCVVELSVGTLTLFQALRESGVKKGMWYVDRD